MGIDLSKLSDGELKNLPAETDWCLALPDDYPDLVVTAAWRQQLCTETACQFVRWVMNGTRVEITHEYDPPWDASGEARHYPTDMKTLLELHETLDGWLTGEYTGEAHASFETGAGWFWHTFEDELEDEIGEQMHDLIKTQFMPVIGDDDDGWEQFWEDIYLVELALHQALRFAAGRMTTLDAWKNYRTIVNAEIEDRRQLEEAQARANVKHHQLEQFWQRHFADLIDMRIEKREFYVLKLAERLEDVLADTDPDIVELIVEMGLPGDFSNSVEQIIKDMAKNALVD